MKKKLPRNYMKHSTECILLSKVRFFLDLATFWNPYRPLSWSNPFCTWKFFVFLWIRFPLCEHHITIWPNSPAKFPKDTGRKLINSQKCRAPWSYILVNGGSTNNVEWTRLAVWATKRSSWSKKMQHVELKAKLQTMQFFFQLLSLPKEDYVAY